jgi:hypothetical protein
LSLVKPLHSRFIDVTFQDSKMIGINWTTAKTPLDTPSQILRLRLCRLF